MGPVIVLMDIAIIVLLIVLCYVLHKFHNFTRSIMAGISKDIVAMRRKFCPDLEGEKVKHTVKPMPKRYFKPIPPEGLPPVNRRKDFLDPGCGEAERVVNI